MINPIEIDYIDYEKITDDLYMIGQNLILRFNVSLAKKTNNGERYHFHHEFKYDTDKYTSQKYLASIKRSFDYFLSIENIKDEGYGKDYVMIGVQNIYSVQSKFKEATKWFMSEEFRNLFVMKKNKMVMIGNPEPIIINNLPLQKVIVLEPVICSYNDQYAPGIRLYISETNYTDMTIDKYMGLLYLIENINMYESAQLMINYLQRPEFGTNMYSSSREQYMGIEKNSFASGGVKREIKPKRQGSFFDKMDNM